MKHIMQKGPECWFATMAMLAGVDYEKLRCQAREIFGLGKRGSLSRRIEELKPNPYSAEAPEVEEKKRELMDHYHLSFSGLFTDFGSVPTGVGQVRAWKYTAHKRISHALAYEKHDDGSVTFHDPSLPGPSPMELWLKASPEWCIVAIVPLKERTIP